ncbi:hypothetical protein P7K49_035492 [Saguinus oedipus]|uniref:DUF4706 domain-containing protein n=1 Tax=Saguinus oedipus TaxID=9490 RepID=A0ABQ9TMQ9_SAGOE|nr:hypothetical protein P7K49_035492 [Saguinus oedipus]
MAVTTGNEPRPASQSAGRGLGDAPAPTRAGQGEPETGGHRGNPLRRRKARPVGVCDGVARGGARREELPGRQPRKAGVPGLGKLGWLEDPGPRRCRAGFPEGAWLRAGGGVAQGGEGAGTVRGGAGRGVAGRQGMASMAAAIAASRSAVMSGNRPLDDRERKRFTYFSSLSPMARKIMQDKEKIREKYGPEWARLPPAQQDEIIDRCLVGPRALEPRDPGDSEELARFPGLRGPTGQKVVRFGDEVGAGLAVDPVPSLAPEAPLPGGHLPACAPPAPVGRGWKEKRNGRGSPEPKVGGWLRNLHLDLPRRLARTPETSPRAALK